MYLIISDQFKKIENRIFTESEYILKLLYIFINTNINILCCMYHCIELLK